MSFIERRKQRAMERKAEAARELADETGLPLEVAAIVAPSFTYHLMSDRLAGSVPFLARATGVAEAEGLALAEAVAATGYGAQLLPFFRESRVYQSGWILVLYPIGFGPVVQDAWREALPLSFD